jgi:hypothetical protein
MLWGNWANSGVYLISGLFGLDLLLLVILIPLGII